MSAEARQWIAYLEPDAQTAEHCLAIVDRVLAVAISVIAAQ
jgi:hypothetical protein